MNIAIEAPDLAIAMRLDHDAPRAARFYVGQVDRRVSPDLRDAVALLTSDMVTRALIQLRGESDDTVTLRVWMPSDVVRVELELPRDLLVDRLHHDGPHYEEMLLAQLADRWAVDVELERPRMWFEIDRSEAA